MVVRVVMVASEVDNWLMVRHSSETWKRPEYMWT